MYEIETKHIREYRVKLHAFDPMPFDVLAGMVKDAADYARVNGCDDAEMFWNVEERGNPSLGADTYLTITLDMSAETTR